MSTPNTLSYLIQFKTDLSVLNKAVSWLEQAQRRVQQYNATMQNGTRAINAGLQAAAGFFAVGAIKSYVGEAVEMRKAQGQLDQALKKSGQYSAEYSEQLAAQADALESATGVDSTRVQVVQRELSLAGVKKKDMAELTALTLDYAAAREVEAGAAAKLVGQTLRGEGDSIKGLGVELDLTKGRVEAIKSAFAQFKGQAAEAIAALPPELRAFDKAAGDAKKAAGQFVLEISAPALEGFAKGLKSTEESLNKMTREGSTATSVMRSLSSAVGEFAGRNLSTIVALVAGFLALKGGIYAVHQVSLMLGATWMAITNTQFIPLIARIQRLTITFGLLRTVLAGGWLFAGATGLLALLAAIGGYAAGKAINSAIWGHFEQQQQAITATIGAQSDAYADQWDKIHTVAEAEALRAKQLDETKRTQEEIAALEERKQKKTSNQLAMAGAFSGFPGAAPSAFTGPVFTPSDETRLEALRTKLATIAEVNKRTADSTWIARKIGDNQTKADDAAEVQRAELVRKKELLALENQLLVAQAQRNQPEIDRLQRLVEERKLNEEYKAFGTEAAGLVQSRLSAEDTARAATRREQQEAFDLQIRQLEAELAGNRALQDKLKLEERERQLRIELQALGPAAEAEIQRRLALERQQLATASALAVLQAKSTVVDAELSRIEQARSNITSSTLLDEVTKRRRLTENTEEYRRVLARVLDLKLQERALSVDQAEQAALDAQIAQLRASGASYGAADLQPGKMQATANAYVDRSSPEQHYQSVGEGAAGGAMEYITSVGTLSDQIAAGVRTNLGGAVDSVTDGLMGWVKGTKSFGAAMASIGSNILQTVLRTIIQIGVQQAVVAVAGRAIQMSGAATALATNAALAAGISAVMIAPATLATIASFGAAAAQAPASIAMALTAAAPMGLAMADGGPVKGPGGPRDDRVFTWLSNGEFVIPADRVQQYGSGFLESVRAGTYLADNATGALASRGASVSMAARDGISAGTSAAPAAASTNVTASPVSIALFDDELKGRAWAESAPGQRTLARLSKRQALRIG